MHAFVAEERLVRQGKLNYWGYNTLAFFAAHAPYASAAAQAEVKEPRDGAARRADTKGSHGVRKRGKKR